jgi:hypothetical protein
MCSYGRCGVSDVQPFLGHGQGQPWISWCGMPRTARMTTNKGFCIMSVLAPATSHHVDAIPKHIPIPLDDTRSPRREPAVVYRTRTTLVLHVA